MKKSGKILTVLALLLSLCAVPVSAAVTGGEDYSLQFSGDYLPALTAITAPGSRAADDYQLMFGRFKFFSQEYYCRTYLYLWNSLEDSRYTSFEEAQADIAQYVAEDSVCILYFGAEDLAWAHVGGAVIPGFDAGEVEKLLHTDAEDEFYKVAAVFNALCDAAGEATGHYVNGAELGLSADWQELEGEVKARMDEVLLSLHEVFPGYVYVDFRNGEDQEGTSLLRKMGELDYDEIYDHWLHKLDYYFRDAIYITYYSGSGQAYLDIGENAGIQLSQRDIEKVEKAFQPAQEAGDLSGFSAGIGALTETIAREESGLAVGPVVAAAALLLVVGAVLIIKRKGKQ